MTMNDWSFLAPWWRVLERFDLETSDPDHHPHACMHYETLYVTLSNTRDWERVHEAMEIVAMVAFAESCLLAQGELRQKRPFHQGVMSVVQEKMPRDFSPTNLAQPIRFGLRIVVPLLVNEPDKLVSRIFDRLFSPFVLSQRSKKYHAARQRILDNIPNAKLRRQCEWITIPVVVTMDFLNGVESLAALYDELSGVYAKQQREVSSMFVLEGIKCFGIFDDLHFSQTDADKLCALFAYPGVPIIGFYPMYLDQPGPVVREWLEGIVNASVRPSRLKLRVQTKREYEQDYISIFSRIASGVTFEEFTHCQREPLDTQESQLDPMIRRGWLQWMAFAFFSPFSKSTVATLNLEDACFTLDDAMAIQQVLEARNPFQVLLGASETDCLVATLQEDIYLPNEGAELASGTVVWIIHDHTTRGSVEILVPGSGVYEVSCSSISMASPCEITSHMTRLELSANQDFTHGNDGLLRLADVLGPYLTGLALVVDEDSDRDIGRQELDSLLRACPHLDFLELGSNVQFFGSTSLTELYNARLCHISVLKCSVSTEEELLALVDGLTSSQSQMASRLRELYLCLGSEAITDGAIAGLVELLEKNTTLEAVNFGVPMTHERIVKRAINSVPPGHVTIPRTPVLDVKLALLGSCYVADAVSNPVLRAFASMDKAIFASIFAYAATPKKRIVGLNEVVLTS
ncbi:hypothetical protein Poli38472_013404 [Pythium oligandrum]|uniref:Uncharacterized protein n=1 Tax=Pythium oligandrum TaxID=41045 RepID=A0A8K1FC49_PYTOL|nr:hypothetical protein Poli38472_013404 [Pythium oligandrum]|eukprot:TMW57930.1 hypothetical protein Poli38472_013404 [Pythium oligandrum]